MNGLLYKDLLNLNSTVKYLVFMALIFCVVFIPMGNELLVYIILVMFGTMVPTTAFSLDAAARWDKYVISLPFSRREIVRSRYLLMLLGIFAAGIVSLVIGTVMTILMLGAGLFFSLLDPLSLMMIFVVCGLLLGSVALPLKFGVEKMCYIIMVIALTLVVLILGMMFLMDLSWVTTMSVMMPVLLGVLWVIAAVVVGVSYGISVRIYEKKEF